MCRMGRTGSATCVFDHIFLLVPSTQSDTGPQLSRRDATVATYVPSRSTAPEGFETRDYMADGHQPIAKDKAITRAHIEFLDAAPTDEAFRDEVVLSLLVFQHLARVTGGDE